jgi:hypothetical protein
MRNLDQRPGWQARLRREGDHVAIKAGLLGPEPVWEMLEIGFLAVKPCLDQLSVCFREPGFPSLHAQIDLSPMPLF